MEVLVRMSYSASGTKVFPFECDSSMLIWHLKVLIFGVNAIPPSKQILSFEDKELENGTKISSLFKKTLKPVLEMKSKSDEKRNRGNRMNKKKVTKTGKRFREVVCPQYCFAGGRGTLRGVVGIPCEMILQAVAHDFQVVMSKDGRMFDVSVEKSLDREFTDTSVTTEVNEKDMTVSASWIADEPGRYLVSVRVYTADGKQDIHKSPFAVEVQDHQNSGAEVKRMIRDNQWNVEAAQILADWASKEEFHDIILKDIGMADILDLLLMKPKPLIHPLMNLAFTRLIQKDSTKVVIVKEGGISGLLSLLQLSTNATSPFIARFVSRSFATMADAVIALHDTNTQLQDDMAPNFLQFCNYQFFQTLSEMLDQGDSETLRNCARALARFSSKEDYLNILTEVNIYPKVVGLFEDSSNDVSVRRSALTTIANLSSQEAFARKHFTEARLLSITNSICHPYTEDLLISNAVRALANLAQISDLANNILTTYFQTVETILQYTLGTDSQAAWEVDVCLHLLPTSVDKRDVLNSSHPLHRDDKFNFESVRLISNLLTNSNNSEQRKKLIGACKPAIPNIVGFIKSLNLELQYVACKLISYLSQYEETRKEIIHIGGLNALCSALNTCTPKATSHIVAALAQMPLDIKGSSVIGEKGIEKLIALLKQSDNLQLQKDTAILLATLAGSDENRKIVNQGGAAFLRSLIDLVHKRKVNVETRIPPNELSFDKVVGQGIAGIVWKAIWKDREVAVKKFDEESIAFSLEEFNSEVALMSVLRHENIVHCIGSSAEPGSLYIVSELFNKGCASNIIEDKKYNLTTSMALHLALGAAKGMKYLHKLGIIHRDLKNGNILIGDDWTAKVADFGLSRMTDNQMTRGVGTPIYTAPEALAGNVYTQKADVYSFAFVLWELVTRDVPFKDIPPFDAAIRAQDENLRPPIPDNCIFEGLITSCWEKNPDTRPSFTEIVTVLEQLQLLVGLPEEVSGSATTEEDLEEAQYNYKEANDILTATLRPQGRNTKRKGSRTKRKEDEEPKKVPIVPDRQPKKKERSKNSREMIHHERKLSKGGRIKNRKSASRELPFSLDSSMDFQEKTPSNSNLLPPAEPAPVPKEVTILKAAPPATPPTLVRQHAADLRKSGSLPSRCSPGTTPPQSPSPTNELARSYSPTTKNSQATSSHPTLPPSEICAQCGNGIPKTVRNIKVDEIFYHIECFVCTICNKSLLQQSWVQYDGKPYCREDYQDTFAPKCGKCNKVLQEKYVNALDRNWHKDCFVCFKCNEPLGKFEEVNGNPYCSSCAATF